MARRSPPPPSRWVRSEEHTSDIPSLMHISHPRCPYTTLFLVAAARGCPSSPAPPLLTGERTAATQTPLGYMRTLSARPVPGMRRAVHVEQPGSVDGGVALGGRQRGVPQQFLDGAQVAAAAEQVGGEGVPERVGRGGLRQAEPAAQDRKSTRLNSSH